MRWLLICLFVSGCSGGRFLLDAPDSSIARGRFVASNPMPYRVQLISDDPKTQAYIDGAVLDLNQRVLVLAGVTYATDNEGYWINCPRAWRAVLDEDQARMREWR